ncbi:hypothetical protein N7520_001239 [Penicillium odoratum]|uniref:uncharacterized protein n=1 Tax=Penicillium odoratum TaxID=1167516 RepID=UPI00254934C4|nr:uncharacterized protein N7520_001239 [Penicillium odoratum]KAJ5777993.1 hypothetical protein N7520_001239 [Penicillium odoratum]
MLDFVDDASRREKCFTTITQLPASVDPKQVASKKSPFSAILNHPFVHTVETILPKDAYDSIQASLDATLQNPQYARVFMYPSDILENEFFNTYIKTGNILMISEGRAGLDTVFTLRDGLLKIEAGKEIYERIGLSGKSIRSGGRKHNKERFVIELNLRLPSMLHGKKGFDRIVWSFKNVLNQSMSWLFCDLDSAGQNNDAKPVQKHSPQWFNCAPLRNSLGRTVIPPLSGLVAKDTPEVELQEACGSFSEWIALVQMRSPRVSAGDDVDPYLSRYSVPDLDKASTSELISLKWHGLISTKWILHLFSSLLSQTTSFSSSAWFILSASALGKQAVEGRDGFTIAAAPNICSEQAGEAGATDRRHAICWEFVGATTTEN